MAQALSVFLGAGKAGGVLDWLQYGQLWRSGRASCQSVKCEGGVVVPRMRRLSGNGMIDKSYPAYGFFSSFLFFFF